MPGTLEARVQDVDPEVRRDRALEAEHDAHHADIRDGVVARALVLGQIRRDAADIRRRHGADHGVGRKMLRAGDDAGDAAIRDRHAGRCGAEAQLTALLFDGARERVHQRLRAALDVAEFLLQQRAARGAEALDARPDPRRGDVVGVFEEFQPEQRRPQPLVDRAAAPARDPVLGRDVFEAAPVAASGREEHHRAVAQLLDQRELRKFQQRDRIAPRIQRAVDVVTHRGRHPAHLVAQAQLGEQVEGRADRPCRRNGSSARSRARRDRNAPPCRRARARLRARSPDGRA